MMDQVGLEIDGRAVQAAPGTTILSCAEQAGIRIPHLCWDSRLKPTGACRLCIVEIDGQPGYHISCTRVVEQGMRVRTQTEGLRGQRTAILEMLVSEHDLSCTTCDRDGDCLLQDYAYEYRIDEKRFPCIAIPGDRPNYTTGSLALSYDPSKCVRCGRCVRICEEVQGVEALTLTSRGGQVEVSTGFGVPLQDSSCELCGQCVGACPTAALYETAARGRGKRKDLVRTRTTCPYCGVGCQIDLNVDPAANRIVRVTAEPGTVPNDGNTCVKGRFGMDFVGSADRLRTPLVRENGAFREASWEEALGYVAEQLLRIRRDHGSDALAGLASAKATNEENYVMQRVVRAAFGTNNVDHCARLCHASSVTGLAMAFGSGAMTNSIAELRHTPLILVIGSNTTECHPVIGILIRQAVASGSHLIVADPRRISLAQIAHQHLRHRSGSDVALLSSLAQVIVSEGLEDRRFIAERTEGFESFRDALGAFTPEIASALTGVPPDQIREAARAFARAPSAAIVYSMGITQHTTGTDNVLAVANLALLTGNVGREHSGVNPLRGQNNVQGACDMGALPNVYPGYQKVEDPAMRAKFERAWGAELPGRAGLTVVEILNAAAEGRVRGLYIMGENPMLSDPDQNHVRSALEAVEFLVVQDVFLTETAQLAHVVLPACSFAEKTGTYTNTERRVQLVRPALRPPGEAREDWQILCDVGSRMGHPMEYRDAAAIMDEIASLTPSYGGMRHERLARVGLQWPCPNPDHPGTPYLHRDKFARGLGKFHALRFLEPREMPDGEYPLVLTTGRILQHFHTGTMTRRSEVLDALVPHGCLEIHPDDARRIGIAPGEVVAVRSRRGRIEIPAQPTEKVTPGTVFLAFHFREHPANALTIAALDPLAKIPEFKVCAVQVDRLPEGARFARDVPPTTPRPQAGSPATPAAQV